MVDIHSHILPFVDDGSISVHESMEMLKIASYSGTKSIVLTPHTNLYDDLPNYPQDVRDVFDAFKTKVDNEGIDINIYLGGELYCKDNIRSVIDNGDVPTINGSRFVLVEFDFYTPFSNIANALTTLSGAGFVPIVAHPERYECVKSRRNAGIDIMNGGGLLQVNKGSLFGDFGEGAKACANDLINRRMAHFVASDAHTSHGRNPDMELAFDIVRDDFGDDVASKLFVANPSAVLANEKLVISRPIL